MSESEKRPRKRRRRFAPLESLATASNGSGAVAGGGGSASKAHPAAAKDEASNGGSNDVRPDEPGDMPTAWPACRSVEHYERLNFIDEGTYGRVFRARETATGRIYALKQLKEMGERDGFPRTSLREVTTLFAVAHPNVVALREVVVSDSGSVYMVMEYAAHDVASILGRMKRPYAASEVKALLQQLLRGVAHLHDKWVVHRDLKPSNLLLTGDGVLKICDFGLARPTPAGEAKRTPGVTTLWYRAPEVLLADTHYGSAIDMWAVGCIFAELVRRKPLFSGSGELDQLRLISEMLGPPSSKVWKGFDKLPNASRLAFPYRMKRSLRDRLRAEDDACYLSHAGVELAAAMLRYDPEKRITAEQALKHEYFKERPAPKEAALIQTFPDDRRG